MKCNHVLLIVIYLKGVKISGARNLLFKFHIRMDSTKIASRIGCVTVLKYHSTDKDDIAESKNKSYSLFFLFPGDLYKSSQ